MADYRAAEVAEAGKDGAIEFKALRESTEAKRTDAIKSAGGPSGKGSSRCTYRKPKTAVDRLRIGR
jgi:hypothetical protein